MYTTKAEKEFFLSHLNKDQKVLEWGSGSSTKEISSRVNSVLSIEHDLVWFNKVKETLPDNSKLVHIPTKYQHNHLIHGDGTYDNFEDYVNYPLLENNEYDVIFIDGRCRVECASICKLITHEKSIVFIHDFSLDVPCRQVYASALNYLEKIDQVQSMAKFEVKR